MQRCGASGRGTEREPQGRGGGAKPAGAPVATGLRQTYLLSMLPLTMRLGGLSLRLTQVKSPRALPSFERQRSASRLYTRIWEGRQRRGFAVADGRPTSNTSHQSPVQGRATSTPPAPITRRRICRLISSPFPGNDSVSIWLLE